MMSDKKERKTKGTISEDDTISLFQRYGATTILTLLQEIAQCADVKIDWERIVKRSSTGISNPREYQLLWRHLAYREPLLENIDGTEPMDDDSDLEFEVENVPAVSAEVASQAAAVVKRWATLKKRLANSNIIRSSKSISLAQSEALDAARFALNSALKMPSCRSFSVINAGAVQSTTPSIISTSSTVSGALCRSTLPQNPNLLQEAPSQATPENGILIPSNKPQSIPESPRTTTSSLIKAAAFAAGGRIVAPSAAASLFQAVQQSKNVVHIRAGGSQLTSIANKGRQQSSSHTPAQSIMMRPPPSPGIPPKVLDGSKVLSNKKLGNSNLKGKSSATGAQQVSCSAGNAEKTSASNAVEGLPTGVTDGGDKTELEKDTRAGKDVDITVDNSNL